MEPNPLALKAHQHAFGNEKEILQSQLCGCFYCLSIFPKEDIQEWTDWTPPKKQEEENTENPQEGHNLTAICPICLVDSVIGDASGLPITKKFLTSMYNEWF